MNFSRPTSVESSQIQNNFIGVVNVELGVRKVIARISTEPQKNFGTSTFNSYFGRRAFNDLKAIDRVNNDI